MLLLLVVYLGAHTMPRAWSRLNTDFPNYYMAARLVHERYEPSRMYEWIWLQREKDHRAIDDRVIGLIPITPFSTLAVWPLTGLPPLTAKHVWLVLNLALLFPIGWMLRGMSGLSYRRTALVLALSFPLHRNLLFGQFYVVLLLLLVAACWAYLREHYIAAGALVGIAAACKIFPALFLVFFLQRRAWRALVGGVVTGLGAIAASVAVFGWNAHRTYVHEVLPWTLRGECLPPYVTSSASISSVLHFLFLAEPQWNPHPWHSSVLSYAVLQPLLQTVLLAPAILLIRREDHSRERILLEWSGLLTAALAISTIPASYDFVLMALPVCVLATVLVDRGWYGWLAVLVLVYVGLGFPVVAPSWVTGPAVLFFVPRLPLMIALLVGIYALLWREGGEGLRWDWTWTAWAAALGVSALAGIWSTFHVERGMREEYAYRVPVKTLSLMEASPEMTGAEVRYIALRPDGYNLLTGNGTVLAPDASAGDVLSFTSGAGDVSIERAESPRSRIVDLRDESHHVVEDAREPMLSVDGQSLAFVRDDRGRGRLMMRQDFQTGGATEVALTPVSMGVYEASVLSEEAYVFSAVEGRHIPQIYLTDATHRNAALELGEARYPALSPDGRWMAYSRFNHGVWNLWLRDEMSGGSRRIADVPCNQIEPSWEKDSKTLLYATDCGRSLWFTAVARRRVVP